MEYVIDIRIIEEDKQSLYLSYLLAQLDGKNRVSSPAP